MATDRTYAFLSQDHDHGHCISDALLKAEKICAQKGARLTRIRRSVLASIWESHAPVGAYDILERLNARGRRTAPITVYRALDFLMSCSLVHRLVSMSAYTGCGIPGQPHGAHFLICTDCGSAVELHNLGIDRAILQGAKEAGFSVKAPVVEIQGQCLECQEGAAG